jgi:hypothetical protein
LVHAYGKGRIILFLNQALLAAFRIKNANIILGISKIPMAGKTAATPIFSAIMPLTPAAKEPIPKLRKKLMP